MTWIHKRLTAAAKRLIAQQPTGGQPMGNDLFNSFLRAAQDIPNPVVLELGTLRSQAQRSTLHTHWMPHASAYLGTDLAPGIDVDIVADLHKLSAVTGEERFDVIISCSTFEHLKYPHMAAHELMKALRIGGVLFIQTHQTFPIHAFPFDYFRFSREGLTALFGTQMGFDVLASDYEFPATIVSKADPGGADEPSFLNVRLFGKKTAATPSDYIYELDTAL